MNPESPLPPRRPPNIPRERSTSPPSPAVQDSTGIFPVGVELIVRNVWPPPAISKVTKIRDAILKDERFKELENCKIEIFRPGNRRDEETSTVYIRLANQTASLDPSPRPDLLERWKEAFQAVQTDWQVQWSPQGMRDKRNWVRFTLNKNAPATDQQCTALVQWAEKQGIRIANSFVNKNQKGSICLIPAFTHHADRLLEKSVDGYHIPSISHECIFPSAFKQVEPIYAFELVITGLNNYPDIIHTLSQHFRSTYRDPDSQTSLVHSTRIAPEDSDCYCILMSSWEATARVLQDEETFIAKFKKGALKPSSPRLLYIANAEGFYRQTTNEAISKAGATLGGDMRTILNQVDDLRNEMRASNQAHDARFSCIESGFVEVAQAMKTIQSVNTNLGLAILGQQQQSMTQQKQFYTQLAINNKEQQLRQADSIEEKEIIQTELRELYATNDQLIAESLNQGMAITSFAGSIGGVLPAPGCSQVPTPTRPADIAPSTPSRNTNPVTPSQPVTPAQGRPPIILIPPTPVTPTRQGRLSKSSEARFSEPKSNELPQKRQRRSSRASNKNSRGSLEQVIEDSQERETSPEAPDIFMEDLSQQRGQMEAAAEREYIRKMEMSEVSKHTITRTLQLTKDPTELEVSSVTPKPAQTASSKQNGKCYRQRGLNFVREGCYSFHPFYRFVQICFSILPSLYVIIVLLLLAFLVPPTQAASTPSSALSIYALNANGMTHQGKIHNINTVLRSRQPHIFVISETKTNTRLKNKLPEREYNIFEENAVRASNSHLYKWGIIVGIRKDVQIAQVLTTNHQALKGRLIAVDIVLATNCQRGYLHRFLAAYAPWNPGGDTISSNFWTEVTRICNDSQNGWTLAGDLNATISPLEKPSGGADSRERYKQFLLDANGHDLWSDYPDRSPNYDWTCRVHGVNQGGSIIDRVASSKKTLVDSEIFVADKNGDYIPATDHRGIIANVIHAPPRQTRGSQTIFPSPPEKTAKPRIQYPPKQEKRRFGIFRESVDEKLIPLNFKDNPIIDDESFLQQYNLLSCVITECAQTAFGWTTPRRIDNIDKISSVKIIKIRSQIRQVGAAIQLTDNPQTLNVSWSSRSYHASQLETYNQDPNCPETFRKYLVEMRRKLYKELYVERTREIYARARSKDIKMVTATLLGNSTKRLTPNDDFVDLPTAVNKLDGSGDIITGASEVKEASRHYFQKLYGRVPLVEVPKPWLETESVKQVREKVNSNPFSWPRKATLADLRAMLRRGNPRPSPGPDGWEKWCVKSLSDEALTLVLELHNYEVMNTHFPGDIKDMYITMFHKHGLRTDLANWRGLLLSNWLANSPMTWLNSCLTTYIAKMGVLPETQVATQQGVQTRDLMSYLSGIKCWANQHRQTIYALKRDQMKGFDYLAPEGFYDAINAYGLPSAITDLDRAAQTNTKCFIRTAYGLTDPIVISGVTKQGGPLSPLKSTFTTSLGHRYLNDLATGLSGALIIKTFNMSQGDPHLPDDKLITQVNMSEATDDSFLFATTPETLSEYCLQMERFQYAYGWITQWAKTLAYVLHPSGDPPKEIRMPSITLEDGVCPWVIKYRTIPLIKDELEFLQAKVDNSVHRYKELKDFIESFIFPRFTFRPPITLLRKIVMQSIIARARALLSIQPIRPNDAELLDRLITTKIHEATGFPYRPNTKILTLPLTLHGNDFPSITRINMSLAVEGLVRDLNHHIPSYRNLARITLSDWTCMLNGCESVLDGAGLYTDFTSHYHQIPSSWIIAHRGMTMLSPKLSLRLTDSSYVLSGEISISHAMNMCRNRHMPNVPNGHAIRSLKMKGLTQLKDIGTWDNKLSSHRIVFRTHELKTVNWSARAKANLENVSDIMRRSNIRFFYNGSADLLFTQEYRRRGAEEYIKHLANFSNFEPTRLPNAKHIWATDGSMTPATSSICDRKEITAAVTGSSTLVMCIDGRNSSILQGEQMGIIAALVLAKSPQDSLGQIYTDHRNSVRIIEDARSSIDQYQRLQHMNGRSYYRWILQLIKEGNTEVHYTRGHSNDNTIRSKLNSEADYYASKSHKIIDQLPSAPIPTFTMNDYTLFRPIDGWIESNTRTFIDMFNARITATELANTKSRYRMATWLYDSHTNPSYPYTRAFSSYSALVQLYARLGQLATAAGMKEKKQRDDDTCRFGCQSIETDHHIFVDCPHYLGFQLEAGEALVKRMEGKLESEGIHEECQDFLHKAKYFYSNINNIWPLQQSQYYLGHVPPLKTHLLPIMTHYDNNNVKRERLLHNIYTDWHLISIRLASRIYGDLMREAAREKEEAEKKKRGI